MRIAAGKHVLDYATNDPVFSHHGMLYTAPHIKQDMVIMENQLPLLLLQKIIAFENVSYSVSLELSSQRIL
jgi:hypothetical protein